MECTTIGARDGHLLAVGTADGRLFTVDLQRGSSQSTSLGAFVSRVRSSLSGFVYAVTTDGQLVELSPDGVRARAVKTDHGCVRWLAMSADGERLVTSGDDGKAVVRMRATLEPVLETIVPERAGHALSAAFLGPDVVLVGYQSGFFEAWDSTGRTSLAGGEVLSRGVAAMVASADGSRAILGGAAGGMLALVVKDKRFRAGTVWKGKPPKPISVNDLELAPDGRFVGAFSDETATVFDSANDSFGTTLGSAFYLRSPKPSWNRAMIVSGATFLGRGGLVATSHFDGTVKLWSQLGLLEATLRFEPRFTVTTRAATLDSADAIADWWVGVTAG